jgi:predicted ribosome quality control (RQC) complex YloA/Tae2 family protein
MWITGVSEPGGIYGFFHSMINNYYTIREIINESAPHLESAVIVSCYTQERNRLVLTLEGKDKKSLVISCEPRQNFLYLRDALHRARRNTYEALGDVTGRTITNIQLHLSDRQVTCTLDNKQSILIQLFGPHANVFLTDQEHMILDAFLRAKEHIGEQCPSPKELPPHPGQFGDFISSLFPDTGGTLKEALRKTLPLFGSILHRELCARADVDIDLPVTDYTERQRTAVWDAYVELSEELNEPTPRLYYEDGVPVAMGLIHLVQFFGKPERPFRFVSDAIRTFVNITHKQRSIESEKKELATRVANEIRKADRALRAITSELDREDRAAEYERTGTLLLSCPHLETKGKNVIEVEDINTTGATVIVQVDPKLSIIQNAERYFERARKSRQSRIESARRVESIRKRSESLHALSDALDRVGDSKELQTFIKQNQKLLHAIGIRMRKDTNEELPFRVFRVTGDFEVWAGKSNTNNDLLTMKYAKPHDLWFHARGASGSHVVLKTGGTRDTVPKEAIEQAAAIAAFYSKMKTSKLVPVAMTERKYVRKRKGDPPGTVILSREKVIMIEPKLPETDVENGRNI